MSKLPRVIIDLNKIAENYLTINRRADQAGIAVCGVLKATAGDRRICARLIEAGLTEIGDSRLENFQKMSIPPFVHKVLLRLPALSRLGELTGNVDCSLNCEETALEALNTQPGGHEIMLMADMGDLREGVSEEKLFELGKYCRGLHNLQIIGLGTNLSCFAGVIPTVAKLERLIYLASVLKDEYGLPIRFISGGNSSSLSLLYEGTIPGGINHLRIGEGILLGRETLTGSFLPGLHRDAFMLEAEVIQAQWKPNRPTGEIGCDAFGRVPEFSGGPDGIRLLLNIGHQDTALNCLTPLEPELKVLGGSSDYLVMASEKKMRVGEIVRFRANYWSVLGLMTSPYVEKVYVS
jgi:predicted amino acid racemase